MARNTPPKLALSKPWLRSVTRNAIPKDQARAYPYTLPLIKKIKKLVFHPDVTFLVGENGSGKSTLLEAIAVAWGFNPEGGNKNVRFATESSHSPLHEILKLEKSLLPPQNGYFLRAESFYNVATYMDQTSREPFSGSTGFGIDFLHTVSHGELFLTALIHKFKPNGFFIFDEPEAALSAQRQLAALVRIHELVQNGCQFLIATHSPILLSYPNALILECTADGLKKITYEETEAFRITRAFLNNYETTLQSMLTEE